MMLPNYEWFVNRVVDKIFLNTFTGSHTYCEAEQGSINALVFNYRVKAIEPNGTDPHFLLETWLCEGARKTHIDSARFPLTPEGLAEVQFYINNSITKSEQKA